MGSAILAALAGGIGGVQDEEDRRRKEQMQTLQTLAQLRPMGAQLAQPTDAPGLQRVKIGDTELVINPEQTAEKIAERAKTYEEGQKEKLALAKRITDEHAAFRELARQGKVKPEEWDPTLANGGGYSLRLKHEEGVDTRTAQRDFQTEQATQNRDLRREIAMGAQGAQAEARGAKMDALAVQRRLQRSQQAERMKLPELNDMLGNISAASAGLSATPNAVGLKNRLLPDWVTDNTMLSPEELQTKATIGGLGANLNHLLSGAAISPAEMARLRPYVPSPGDREGVLRSKIANLHREYAAMVQRRQAQLDATFGPEDAAIGGGGASGGTAYKLPSGTVIR